MAPALALIVEDDPKLADIFVKALSSAGYQSESVPDGQRALARLAEIVPAIVILDLHLPHLSGKEILTHIRTDARLASTRVMLTTADALMAESLRKDSDLVLLKPISFTQLRELALRYHPRD